MNSDSITGMDTIVVRGYEFLELLALAGPELRARVCLRSSIGIADLTFTEEDIELSIEAAGDGNEEALDAWLAKSASEREEIILGLVRDGYSNLAQVVLEELGNEGWKVLDDLQEELDKENVIP